MQAMKAAKSGLYCGPLRLLAMEVYDSINQEVITRLIYPALLFVIASQH